MNKKLIIANLLNRIASRLLKSTRIFCARLVSYAIKLDPDRAHIKKNLTTIGVDPDDFFRKKKIKLPFYSVPEGCRLLNQKIQMVDQNQTLTLSQPRVVNTDFSVSEKYQCEAKLPDTYLAELKDATVFSGTDLIMVQNKILYDEIERNAEKHYTIKSPVVAKILDDHLALKIPRMLSNNIECGIHFAKDHSANYFHWIIECLPRLTLVNYLDNTIPLLVDAQLPKQAFEALDLLNSSNRPIIKLKKNKRYHIKNLYYPSQLSVVYDNYDLPQHEKDAVYSPKAIQFVRDTVLQKLNATTKKPRRKIYLSRKYSHYRQLLNTDEIENFLAAHGFDIIFPENLSFAAQVHLFSEAKIIIGQSGAGMANFIFAPKECKVLMFYNNIPQSNLHLFGALAKAVDRDLTFLMGETSQPYPNIPIIHSDFHIDLKILATFLEQQGWLND